MIILGVILLLIGFVTGISILWTLGIIALIIGIILLVAGGLGHTVGPHRYYW